MYKIAFVQKGPRHYSPAMDNVLESEGQVGMSTWKSAGPFDLVRWDSNEKPPLGESGLAKYDAFLVNLFPKSNHVETLRRLGLEGLIIASPDPHLERAISTPGDMYFQMSIADVIGGRTAYDASVYGMLLQKPSAWLPSPIGPTAFYRSKRYPPVLKQRERYILSCDHRSTQDVTAQNVAAVAELQRVTGYDVVYLKPSDATLKLVAGLDLNFNFETVPFAEVIEWVRRAAIGVDLYPGHSQHRHAMVHAMLGTPLIGPYWTNQTGQIAVDPFDTEVAVKRAQWLLNDENAYDSAASEMIRRVEDFYSFEACRDRLLRIVEVYHP